MATKIHTYSALDQVASADLNSIQENIIPAGEFSGIMKGAWRIYSRSGTSIVIEDPIVIQPGNGDEVTYSGGTLTYSPGTLSNSTWYYLYAVDDGTLTHSSTGPTDLWGTTARYLCSFYSDSTGSILPFFKQNGLVRYRISKVSASKFLLIASGVGAGGTGYNDLVNTLVPPHTRLGIYYCSIIATTAGAVGVSLRLRTKDDTSNYDELIPQVEDILNNREITLEHKDTDQKIQWSKQNTDNDITISCYGYYDSW